MLLMHWDYAVDYFQSQPVRIEYSDSAGKLRTYTPDLWVKFHEQLAPGRKPILFEVKYRADLIAQASELKPKFRAARAYAKEQGGQFKVVTETEIRSPYLENVKFLWRYRDSRYHIEHQVKLTQTLEEMAVAPVSILLEATYRSETLRGEALWTLWCLVARQEIVFDMTQPVSMDTCVWLNR